MLEMDTFSYLFSLSVWKLPITAVVVFAFAYTFNWFMRKYVSSVIDRNADFLRVNSTNYNFLKNAFSITIYTLAFFFVLSQVPAFKQASQAVFTATGVFAAVAAFASQHALSNIFSGVFIIVFKPFRVDDIIEFDEERIGVVEDITLRHTIIRNFENKRFIVPNSLISNTIILNSDIKELSVRRRMELLLSYDAPLERVFEIITHEVLSHPYHLDNRTPEQIENGEPEVEIRVLDYLPTGLKIRVYLWADNHKNSFRLHTDLNYRLKVIFEKEGIPFPYTLQRLHLESDGRTFPKNRIHKKSGKTQQDEES